MHDIVDIVKNIQTLAADDSSFKILKDYERVLDDLDLYVFKNWEDGELLAGPQVSRYFVTCKFMWPEKDMPDPVGAERLLEYGCKVTFQKNKILVPRKVRKPSDFRPGTKKGKIDPHPIWVVEITIPKKLMQDIFTGKELQDNIQYAEAMQKAEASNIEPTEAAQEAMPGQVDSTEQTDVPEAPQ